MTFIGLQGRVHAPGRSASPSQRGVSLVEVLVAILVVSLGMMAMIGLLGTASRFGKTSEFRSTASLLAQDIADRMRANTVGAEAGSYNVANTALLDTMPGEAAACDNPDACRSDEIAAIDLAQWQATLFKSLPQGTGYVSVGTDAADVWIVWRDPSTLGDDADKSEFLTDADGKSACPPSFASDPVPSCMYFRVSP